MKIRNGLACFAVLFGCAETRPANTAVQPVAAPSPVHSESAPPAGAPAELVATTPGGWKVGPASAPVAVVSDPRKLDPVKTDGDKYTVILENERVRVLRYHDKPGDETHLHHHDDMVMYPLAPFRRRLTLADGTTREREFKAGEAIWVPDQMHMGENIGSTDTDSVLVELKPR